MHRVCVITALSYVGIVTVSGCNQPNGANQVTGVPDEPLPDAKVQINGLSCPYCVHNVERSLRGVEGVRRVTTDLNTGVATVWFTDSGKPAPKVLWRAVEDSGFQPVHIETEGKTYEFAKQ